MIPLSKLYFVGYPLTNTAMATAFIRDNVEQVFDAEFGIIASKFTVSTTKGLKVFVDTFMARYPRGKGTKGSPLLRETYAACRTIKVAQSRPRWGFMGRDRYRSAALAITVRQAEILASFTDPMEIKTRKNGGITGMSKSYEALSDLGMIMVNFDNRFSVVEAWITDYGMAVAEAARQSVTKLRPYMAQGNEVLARETVDGVEKHVHFAHARDEAAAERIALALNY